MNLSEIKIYESQDGNAQLEVTLQEDTVWLSIDQMSGLFDRDKSGISRHIKNVFTEEELDKNSVVAKFATTAQDGKIYQVEHYNLDVIISVGYRVKSKRGTQFRIWANKILKEYLVKGCVLNEKRLKEKEQQLNEVLEAVQYLSGLKDKKELSTGEQDGILKIINDYAHALQVLDDYDHQELKIEESCKVEHFKITYKEAKEQIRIWRDHQNAGGLFGNEKDSSFEGSLNSIYQTFDGIDL